MKNRIRQAQYGPVYFYYLYMKNPIIFLDVDGTLISFRTHQVPESAVIALKEAYDNGAIIVIATGRPVTDLRELSDIPYSAVIALNGSDIVLRDGKRIITHPIPPKEFAKSLKLAEDYNFIIGIENDRGVIVNRHGKILEEWAEFVAHPVPPVVNLQEEYAKGNCCQLCFFCDEKTERVVMAQLPSLSAARWNPMFADINVKGIDKSTGLEEICQYYGCDISNTIAIVDGGNDIPMLIKAGIGVAMGNASKEVKSVADIITDSAEDNGICNILRSLRIIEG